MKDKQMHSYYYYITVSSLLLNVKALIALLFKEFPILSKITFRISR